MKRILLIAVPALAALAACTKTEVTPQQSAPQQISFTPLSSKPSTKALIDGTTYSTSDPTFGSLAYYVPSGNWNTKMSDTDTKLYIPTSEISYNSTNSVWTTAKPYYWPKSGSLTFFAYSPYNYQETGSTTTPITVTAGTDNDGIVITGYDVDAHQDTDLMVADVTKSKDKTENGTNGSYTGVPIVFQHKLAQIVGINLETVKTSSTGTLEVYDYANSHDGTSGKEYQAGDVVFKLKNVSVKQLNTVGKYTYSSTNTSSPTSVWSDHATTKDYVWYNYTSDNSGNPEQFTDNKEFTLTFNNKHTSNANSYLLVLPQPLTERSATITLDKPYLHLEYQVLTYTDATNYATENVEENVDLYIIHGGISSSSTTGIEIAQNKKITYTIRINLETRQIYWAPSVVDWETESHTYVIK